MAKDNSSQVNFFQRLFDALFGSKDPEVIKKKQLKSIAGELAKTHTNYYKFSSDEVQPALGKLFYQIYKAISPAQTMFQSMQNQTVLKTIVVTRSLNDQEADNLHLLEEKTIREKAGSMPYQQLSESVHQALETFATNFDMDRINRINTLYTTILSFEAFCTYDYYFLLKKFDSSIREREFSTPPHFEPISTEYIRDDLKDFIAVAWALEKDTDWQGMLAFFKNIKGIEPVSLKNWNQILSKLMTLRNAHVFEILLKLATKDPTFEPQITVQSGNIVEPFLEKVKNEALQTLNKLKAEQKKTQVDKLLNQLFGTDAIFRLKNYTEQANTEFIKHQLPTYTFYQPLNYLKAFLIDFVKTDLREFSDLVLVRGQWATAQLAAPMSEAYNSLLETSNQITAFDGKLDDEGEIGIKIKTLLPRSGRDKEAANIINTIVGDVNDRAKGYLISSTRDLITIGKMIKALLEDYAKQPNSEMVVNWKELDHFAEHPIKECGVEIYKKIYLFVSLIQTYIVSK